MLSLYHFDNCPFCELVRRTVSRLGVAVELRDVQTDPAHYQALIEATAGPPFHVCASSVDSGDSSWLHESADIVQFLRNSLPEARDPAACRRELGD